MTFSNVLLGVAFLIGCFQIIRSENRVILKVLFCVLLCLGLSMISWWIQPPLQQPILNPIKMPTAKEIADEIKFRNIPKKEITKAPILIIPNEIKFSASSEWDIERSIEVKNTKPDTVHRVLIKVQALEGTFVFQDIGTELENPEQSLTRTSGNINVNYDMVGWDALDSATKKPCIYLQLFRVRGLESKFIKVTARKQSLNEAKLSFTVVAFNTEASPVPIAIGADGGVAVQITIPTPITLIGYRIKMWRNQ